MAGAERANAQTYKNEGLPVEHVGARRGVWVDEGAKLTLDDEGDD